MSHYLYHKVPPDLDGNILYPLNILRDTKPELYKIKSAKYEGRQQIMTRTIPILNCLWNDVLHLTAVHPKTLADTLSEAGRIHAPMTFYEIDPSLLNHDQTIVYLYREREKMLHVPVEEFIPFKTADLESYSLIPKFTKEYYRECYTANLRPLLYHGVPHILYKRTINITNLPIITV